MTKAEVAQLIGILKARFPRAEWGPDDALTVEAWHITLDDVPMKPHMEVALRSWFDEQKWAPDASELRVLAIDLGGPTPAQIALAEYYEASDAHWQALRGLKHLTGDERRRRHAEFQMELRRSHALTGGNANALPAVAI